MLETHEAHRFQAKDTELKKGGSGPTPEQIAAATNASRVLRYSEGGRRRHTDLHSEAFGGEHSAILELLRHDERLSSLFAARADRLNASGGRLARESGAGGRERSSSQNSTALAQALFGHLMSSSRAAR